MALRSLRSFLRGERGSVAVLFAAVVVPMVIGIGVSTDLMRAYSAKSRLGSALDAAALAAGAAGGTSAQLTALATSYLNINFPAGNGVTLGAPTINVASDPITITATASVQTAFLQIVGVPTITVSASTSVLRTLSGLEVALVLDNTGSLQDYSVGGVTNIMALKAAAANLVIKLFGTTTTANPLLRVAIVPYVASVNPGSVASSMIKSPPTLTPSSASGWTGCVVERTSTFQNFSSTPTASLKSLV